MVLRHILQSRKVLNVAKWQNGKVTKYAMAP